MRRVAAAGQNPEDKFFLVKRKKGLIREES